MSEIYYIVSGTYNIMKSVFKLVWAELEDGEITGEYLEYEEGDPGKGYVVAGVIKALDWDDEWGFVQDDLIWVSLDEMNNYIDEQRK